MRQARVEFLSKDEEHDLARKWRDSGDEKAMHRLVISHTPMVRKVARRFAKHGLSLEDLDQEGYVGLLEAAKGFDPEAGFRFSTYAQWWIMASMQAYVCRNWSMVMNSLSSESKKVFFRGRYLCTKVASEHRDWTERQVHEAVANALGVNVDRFARQMVLLSSPVAHLDEPVPGSSMPWHEVLASDDPPPSEVAMRSIDHERGLKLLNEALSRLSEREAMIVRARWLSDDAEVLQDLGDQLGISKERVRQVEARALASIRDFVLGRRGGPVKAKDFAHA